jgi:hypothetical protein
MAVADSPAASRVPMKSQSASIMCRASKLMSLSDSLAEQSAVE